MKGFIYIFLSEVKIILTKPLRMFMSLVLPLMIFAFFGYMFKNQVIKELPVALVDKNQSSYSRALTRMIQSNQTLQIAYDGVNELDASQLLKTGKIYAYIIIPSDLDKNIIIGKQTNIICYTNSQYMAAAGFIQSSFSQVVGSFSAGINIEKRMKKGQPRPQALASAQTIIHDFHLLYNPYRNYNYFLNLGFIPMMFQMVVVYVSIFSFGMFFKTRSARSLIRHTKATPLAVITGKMLPYTLIFMMLSFVMNVFLFYVVGIPVKSGFSMEAIFLSLLFVLVCQNIAFFAVCIFSNLRLALTIGGGFSAVSFAFAGYTFPSGGMPKIVSVATNIFPLTHFLKAYINVVIRGISISYSVQSICWLVAFFLLSLIAYPRFLKLLKNNGYESNS